MLGEIWVNIYPPHMPMTCVVYALIYLWWYTLLVHARDTQASEVCLCMLGINSLYQFTCGCRILIAILEACIQEEVLFGIPKYERIYEKLERKLK